MPQTLLAFLAILVLTTLTLSQRESKVRNYRKMVSGQMEMIAHGVGVGVIETVASEAFDEYTADSSTATSTDQLEPLPFSTVPPSSRDDIDDYHGAQMIRSFALDEDTLTFTADIRIFYVNSSGERVSDRTFNKEIEVTVQEYLPNGGTSHMIGAVTLKRPVSYDPS